MFVSVCMVMEEMGIDLVKYEVCVIIGEWSSNTSTMDWLTRMSLISYDLIFLERSYRVESVEVFDPEPEEGLKLLDWSNDIDQFRKIEVDDELLLKSCCWNSNVGGDNRNITESLNWKNQDQHSRSKPQINSLEWYRFGRCQLNKRTRKSLLSYTRWQLSHRLLVHDSSPESTTV